MKFQKGDLVMVIARNADLGKIGTVTRCCSCMAGVFSFVHTGLPFYRIESLGGCYREDVLKKIGGDGTKTETHDTRDAPVAA
jgi:hypothetical protein